MKVYLPIKVYFRGPEAVCLGVYRDKDDAIEAIESDETWNDEFRVEGEDFWGNEECSIEIETHEIE